VRHHGFRKQPYVHCMFILSRCFRNSKPGFSVPCHLTSWCKFYRDRYKRTAVPDIIVQGENSKTTKMSSASAITRYARQVTQQTIPAMVLTEGLYVKTEI